MYDIFLRTNGQIYGPYSQQQLTSMIAAGRLAPTAEVSRDRVHWMPASSLQSGADTGPRGGVASPPRRTSVSYLASLRGRTNYPIYRAVVFIFTILGFIAAAIPVVVHVFNIARLGFERYFESIEGQEWMTVLPFFISALTAVAVKFYQEFATMIVDFADSTIDYHSR